MTIGELNRRIEVLQFFETRDEFGGCSGSWKTIDRVWAKIEPISGNEFFHSQQINAETSIKITIRFYAGLNVMHRIKFSGKTFEITGVFDELAEHRWTVINCKELVNDGLQR